MEGEDADEEGLDAPENRKHGEGVVAIGEFAADAADPNWNKGNVGP